MFKLTALALVAALSGFASQAHATVFTYDLVDTPHGNFLDGGFYRFTGGNPRYDTYSLEQSGADLKLRYDDASNTAQINGTGYNLIKNELAEINLFYNDVTRTGNDLSFNDMGVIGAVDGVTVRGKGFGLTVLDDSLSGSGWLTDTAGNHFGDFHLAGNQVGNGGCTGTGNGCTGNEVPAPGPLGLIAAMALFGAWRRRRSTEG